MASFYGNIKNNSRASFIFDKVYPSRCAMEAGLKKKDENNVTIGDGIFINRYILINYNINEKGEYVDRYTQVDSGLEESAIYATHRHNDAEAYGANYDDTVWMKIYIDNEERYIMVGSLDAVAPTFELLPDAPSEQNGEPHFDLRYSDDRNYKYHVPKNWDFILNHFSTSATYDDKSLNDYYYYEKEDENKSFNQEVNYPYYNQEGFNPFIQSNIQVQNEDTFQEGLFLNETKSSSVYPEDIFIPIELTIDTYEKNKYYIPSQFEEVTNITPRDDNLIYYKKELKNQEEHYIAIRKEDPLDDNVTYYLPVGEYQKSLDDYDVNTVYYMPSQEQEFVEIELDSGTYEPNKYYYKNLDGDYVISKVDSFYDTITYYTLAPKNIHKKDTKRLDIYLPSIGNSVSDLYDALYGKPKTGILLGWTTNKKLEDYARKEGEPSNAIHTDPENLENCIFLELDPEADPPINEYKELSKVKGKNPKNEDDPAYEIPVYSYDGSGYRPYIKDLIFDNDQAYYGNLDKDTESFSAGWGIDVLKKYIDELRQLAFGSDGNGGVGLQGDFSQTDSTAFGYIWNKPERLGYYELVPKDLRLNTNYSYYKQVIDENEIRTFEEVTDNNLKTQLQTSGELFTKQPTHEEITFTPVDTTNDSFQKWRVYYRKDWSAPNTYVMDNSVDESNFHKKKSGLFYKTVTLEQPKQTIEDIWYKAEMHDMALTMWCDNEDNQMSAKMIFSKLLIAPNDSNVVKSQFNQDHIELKQIDNNIILSGNMSQLYSFASTNPAQGNHTWIGIDIDTGYQDITKLKWNDNALTEADVQEAADVNLGPGHIIYWLKADSLSNSQTIKNTIGPEEDKQTFNFIFEDYFPLTVKKLSIDNVPNDDNKEDSKSNQENIRIIQNQNKITILGDLNKLKDFNSTDSNQGEHKWIGIDIDTGYQDITKLKWNDSALGQKDVNDSNSLGLPTGHIIYWAKADVLATNQIKIRLSDTGDNNISRTLIFEFIQEDA